MRGNEVWRTCLLARINLTLLVGHLPRAWELVACAPIPKPGKDLSTLDGYRLITPFGAYLKLFDKMTPARDPKQQEHRINC